MRGGSEDRRGERGQALILGALLMVVLLGFTALAVDVGFFLRHRAVVQQAVDAAVLAGAQALPDDGVLATQLAQEYAQKNGVDPATLEISFRCTSGYAIACDPAAQKWDTIQVRGTLDVPFFFAPVLKLAGVQGECFLSTCPVVESAAACRGLCGAPPPPTPVDVVQILDRTGSMSNGDLVNAKAAANTLLDTFDPLYHSVGLGVLGAADPSNNCSSSLPGDWLPVSLSTDYQNADGSLNYGSQIVSTIDCLNQSAQGTNLGDPVKSAVAELQANGRVDTTWGIILLTDGAANQPYANGNTGWRNCASQAPVTSGSGDNNGYESLPQYGCTNGNGYARDWNSGTSTSTDCASPGNDRQVFYNYGVSLPPGSTIEGIRVRLDARVNTSSGFNQMCVELSWDGGVSWTAAKTTGDIGSWWTNRYMGSSSDTWGRTWTSQEVADGNFMVRVTNAGSSGSRDFFLDWATVRVYYNSGIGGPCEFAADQADIAKALGIEVYAVGYGTQDNSDPGFTCGNDTGIWAGQTAEDLLRYMATDDDHFFQEAQGADLAPIFQLIAQQLAGGSRLVPTLQN